MRRTQQIDSLPIEARQHWFPPLPSLFPANSSGRNEYGYSFSAGKKSTSEVVAPLV